MIRLFVVEDNLSDVYLIREAMRRAGMEHHLNLATDGQEAMAMIPGFGREHPCPDLMLLDLNLPRTDGAEVLRRWRDHTECAHRPVVITTSSEAPADRQLAQQYDATFFHKPLDLDEYLEIAKLIRQVITSNGSEV